MRMSGWEAAYESARNTTGGCILAKADSRLMSVMCELRVAWLF